MIGERNKVDGFEPENYLTELPDGGKYLPVYYRKVWFKLKYPEGIIRKKILKLTDNTAVVEANVFADKRDTEPIAMAYAQRTYDSTTMYSNPVAAFRFLESAETAAVGRALSDAGFNVAFSASEEGEEELCDTPVREPVKGEPKEAAKKPRGRKSKKEADAKEAAEESEKQYSELIKPEAGQMIELPESVGEEMIQTELQFPQNEPQDDVPEVVTSEKQNTVMTPEEANKVIVPFGVYKNKTLGEMILDGEKGCNTLNWIAESYAGPNEELREAAMVLIEAAKSR